MKSRNPQLTVGSFVHARIILDTLHKQPTASGWGTEYQTNPQILLKISENKLLFYLLRVHILLMTVYPINRLY
jgi:hypothetical protein